MNFSDSVKEFLNKEGFSPSDLARKTGYSPQYIIDLLKCKRRWNTDTMAKVCEVLELELKVVKRITH
ncbi:helix-turn-helix transcriptional regulator [Paenibacillus larvae]